MRKHRRPQRLRARAIATAAAVAAGTLAFTGTAFAGAPQIYTATNEPTFDAAVTGANANPGSTINVGAFQYNPAATVAFTANTTLVGPAPTPTVSTAVAKFTGAAIVPSGNSLFTVAAGVTVSFSNIQTVTAGNATNGAFDVSGTANITGSTITGNGAGIFVEAGGTLNMTNATVFGGLNVGIIDQGTATLTDTTVTQNSQGGIDNSSGALNLVNSIVAKNGSSKDCYATLASSGGTNDASLDSDNSCGVAAALSGKNPLLGALNLHGGSTPTAIPAAGTPELGVGDPTKCAATDQRGAPRTAGAACDLGSSQTFFAPATFTTANQTTGTHGTTAVVNFTPTWSGTFAPVTVSCAPASGSTFNLGATPVNCGASTDVFNNIPAGASTFTENVVAYSNPTVTTSGNKTAVATSASGASVAFTSSATDTVDGTDATTCTAPIGSGGATITVTSPQTFPIATTTVTCSATNSGGNTGTSTFTVAVTDPAPVVTPSANLTASGATGSTVTFNPIPSSTDFADGTADTPVCTAPIGSGGATVTVTSGTTVFPVGTTTVTCSATNHATPPQTGTATFTVTVNSVTPASTNATVKGEVPNGGSPGGLQITAATCDFGPVFIPAQPTQTYTCTAAVTVTSTDSTTTLSINDISTSPTVGHLVNPIGPVDLLNAATDKATSANSGPGSPTAYQTLTGTATPILTYAKPVNSDPVTLNFQQQINQTEPLTNGTYGATVLLALTGTP